MSPLTRRDIIVHQALVPWPSQRQVEQDLFLCRAMAALFSDKFLRSQIAMRGGTLLHKVHLAPAAETAKTSTWWCSATDRRITLPRQFAGCCA